MVAVQSFRDVFIEVPLTPGIVYLCKRHYYDPILGPSKAPSSPVETTDAPEQRPDHTDVIRGADEREARYDAAMTLSHEDYADALHKVMAVADAENAALTAEVKRLTRVTQIIMATGDADHERLSNLLLLALGERDERDATIERLWAQLNEATNVPDHQCSLSDPECDGTYCADAINAADDRAPL